MKARILTAFLLCISLSLTSLHAMEMKESDDSSDSGDAYVMSAEGEDSDEDYEWESDLDDLDLDAIVSNCYKKNCDNLIEMRQELSTARCIFNEMEKLLSSEESEEAEEAIDYNAPPGAPSGQDDALLSDEEVARRMQEEEEAARAPDRAYNERLVGGQTRWILPWAAHGCKHPKSNNDVDHEMLLFNWPELTEQERKELKAACVERLKCKKTEAEEAISKYGAEVKSLEALVNRKSSSETSTIKTTEQEKLCQTGEVEAKKLEERRTDERASEKDDSPEYEDCQEEEAEAVEKPQYEDCQEEEAEAVEKPQRENSEERRSEILKGRNAFLDRLTNGHSAQA